MCAGEVADDRLLDTIQTLPEDERIDALLDVANEARDA